MEVAVLFSLIILFLLIGVPIAVALGFSSIRFKDNAEKYGFKKEDVLVFKIGQISSLKDIIN